jgi:hypothetical protein
MARSRQNTKHKKFHSLADVEATSQEGLKGLATEAANSLLCKPSSGET